MNTIRVMSHNLWRRDGNAPAWKAKGEDCSAAVRAGGFARVYRETRPDVIGLQACSARMASALMTRLAEERLPYALLQGRDTPVLYRRDEWELADSAFFLYPGNASGSYCFAVLREKGSGKTVLVGTAHLRSRSGDPASESDQAGPDGARTYQMGLFLDKAEELQARYGCPAFILGDLNARYGSPAVQSALARGFVHARDAAAGYRDETSGIHPCGPEGYDRALRPGGFPEATDHVFTRGLPEGAVLGFVRYYLPYYAPLSGHSPVFVDAKW